MRRGRDARLTADERYRFDLEGYLVRADVLEPSEVRRLRAACEAHAADRPVPGASIASQRFHGFLEWDASFRDLVTHPGALDVVRELCGPGVRLDHAYGIQMTAGTSGLGLHGGGTPFDPAQYYLVRDGRPHSGLTVAMWVLVDHPPGAGGFACVPGSHKSAFPRPPDVEDLVRGVPLRAGSLLVFTEALTHGTLPWRSPSDRCDVLFKYSPGNSAWEPPGWVTPELVACFPAAARPLLDPPSVGGRTPI